MEPCGKEGRIEGFLRVLEANEGGVTQKEDLFYDRVDIQTGVTRNH